VLYATRERSNHIRIAKYNGDDLSPTWTFIDGNGTSVRTRMPQKAPSVLMRLGRRGARFAWCGKVDILMAAYIAVQINRATYKTV